MNLEAAEYIKYTKEYKKKNPKAKKEHLRFAKTGTKRLIKGKKGDKGAAEVTFGPHKTIHISLRNI